VIHREAFDEEQLTPAGTAVAATGGTI